MSDKYLSGLLYLPLELRERIYYFVLHPASNTQDVTVRFRTVSDNPIIAEARDQPARGYYHYYEKEEENVLKGQQPLQCDEWARYRSLTLVCRQIQAESVDFFFRSSCFRFTETARPFGFVVDAFCARVPRHNRERIHKVAITHFTTISSSRFDGIGHIVANEPDSFHAHELGERAIFTLRCPQSPYYIRLSRQTELNIRYPFLPEKVRMFLNMFRSDFLAGMEALAMNFPSLTRLDLGMNSFEWVSSSDHIPENGLLRNSLRILNASPAIGSLQIRFQWNSGAHGGLPRMGKRWESNPRPTFERWIQWARDIRHEMVKVSRTELCARDVTVDETTQELELFNVVGRFRSLDERNNHSELVSNATS